MASSATSILAYASRELEGYCSGKGRKEGGEYVLRPPLFQRADFLRMNHGRNCAVNEFLVQQSGPTLLI